MELVRLQHLTPYRRIQQSFSFENSLAHMVEHLCFKQKVIGSSPIIISFAPWIWVCSSVGRSGRLKPYASVVQVHPGPPTAVKQHPLHKMHGDVWCNTTGLVSVWYYGRVFRVLCYPQANNEKHINSVIGWKQNETLFHIFLKSMEQKTITYEEFFTPGFFKFAFFPHSFLIYSCGVSIWRHGVMAISTPC